MSTASTQKKPLAGLRILDLTSVLMGPYATLFLADFGAEVIKVEPLAGDPSRRLSDAPKKNMAAVFQHINRGKRSLVLDLKRPEGIAVIKRLLPKVDALIYNIRPNAMRRLGLSYADVAEVNSKIVYCGLLGFDERGRYAGKPALDDVIQGISGISDLMARSGSGEPRYIPMAMADRIVGLYAAIAILSALLGRERQGAGYEISIPMFESMVHFVLVEHMHLHSFPSRGGPTGNPRTLDANRKPFRTADGFISVIPYTDRHWQDVFTLLGVNAVREDPRFLTLQDRVANTAELYGLLASHLVTRSTAEWLDVFAKADVPAMRLNTIDDLFSDPHLEDIGFFQSVGSGETEFLNMKSPFFWRDMPEASFTSAPELGQQSVEVLRFAGFSDDEIENFVQQGVTAYER